MVYDELMAKSVMDEPRSAYQRLVDFAVGRTPSEQITGAFTGIAPLAVRKIAVPTYNLPGSMEMIPQAMRAMGRDVLNYLRNKGYTLKVTSMTPPRSSGAWNPSIQPNQSMVGLMKGAGENVPFHEIPGHMGVAELPERAKALITESFPEAVMPERIRFMNEAGGLNPDPFSTTPYGRLANNYELKDVPKELAAWSREPEKFGGRAAELDEGTRKSFNRAFRNARGKLRSMMREEP
jgi:hypothetical protein